MSVNTKTPYTLGTRLILHFIAKTSWNSFSVFFNCLTYKRSGEKRLIRRVADLFIFVYHLHKLLFRPYNFKLIKKILWQLKMVKIDSIGLDSQLKRSPCLTIRFKKDALHGYAFHILESILKLKSMRVWKNHIYNLTNGITCFLEKYCDQ